MAPRRYPELTTRLSLTNIRGPSGIGMQEAQRTSQMLIGALDNMSSYYFKKAGKQAEIEGAEFGAKNAITEEQLKKGGLSGEELEERLGDTSTIFGRASRKASLAVLETELELSGRKLITETMTNAVTNDQDVDDLSDALDAITLQFSKLASTASPIVAQRITANLNTVSSSKYHEYAIKKANETVKLTRAKNLALINDELDNIPTVLKKAVTESPNEEALDNILVNGVQLLKKNYFNKISKYAKTSESFNKLLDKFDDQVLAFKENYILQTASINGQEVKITRAIRNNNFAKVDFRIKKIVLGMDDTKRRELNKNLTAQVKERLELEEKDEKLTIQLNKEKISDITNNILESLGDKNRDMESAKESLTELKILDRDAYDKLYPNYVKALDQSDPDVLAFLQDQADRGTLTLQALTLGSDRLVGKDIDKLRDQFLKNQDKDLKLALSYLTSEFNKKFEGFNPATLDSMQKKNKFLKPMSQYKRIKYALEAKLDTAKEQGKEVDLVNEAKIEFDKFKTDVLDAQEQNYIKNANLVLKQLKDLFGSTIPELENIEENEFLKINNLIIRHEEKIKDKQGSSKLDFYKKTLLKVLAND
tara:strand:- start:529 stop:2310 length:1782 start_codon:yes stop_codon:yes gene_type:complete